jgi:hypothetical protein
MLKAGKIFAAHNINLLTSYVTSGAILSVYAHLPVSMHVSVFVVTTLLIAGWFSRFDEALSKDKDESAF